MAKFMDYFFLRIFYILIYLKKDEGDAKWIAFLQIGLFATATEIVLLSLLGLLHYDNFASTSLKINTTPFVMITGVIITLLSGIRYYRYTSVDVIETSYKTLDISKRRLVDILVYTAMIAIPVLSFILYRLYAFGRI